MGSVEKRKPTTYLKMVLVLAKLRMGPRTMSIPRSSDALSWRRRHRAIFVLKDAPKGGRNPPITPSPPSHPHLQHHGAKLPLPVELLGAGEDGRGLTGTGRSIEEKMGESIFADEPLHWRRDNGFGGCPVPPREYFGRGGSYLPGWWGEVDYRGGC